MMGKQITISTLHEKACGTVSYFIYFYNLCYLFVDCSSLAPVSTQKLFMLEITPVWKVADKILVDLFYVPLSPNVVLHNYGASGFDNLCFFYKKHKRRN